MLRDISTIRPDPNQPRKYFDEDGLNDLAKNIQLEGIIHPLEIDEDGVIIVGERRYRASKIAGLREVPVTINTSKMTPYERLRRQMSENLMQSSAKNGEGMKYLDTAKAWVKMYELKTGRKYVAGEHFTGGRGIKGPLAEIVDEVGASRSTVAQILELLNQPEFVTNAIEAGTLPRTFIREIEFAPDEIKNDLKRMAIDGKFQNRNQLRTMVKRANTFPTETKAALHSIKITKSYETNHLLDRVISVAQIMFEHPFNGVDPREKQIVENQLLWLKGKIDEYLTQGV